VEALYNEYQFSAAFAVATLLVGVAAIAIVAKRFAEGPHGDREP
jgi:sulfate transport system permease protein